MPTKSKKIVEPVEEPEYLDQPVPDQSAPLEEDTVTFKRSHFYSVLTLLAFGAGILVGYLVWGVGIPGLGVSNSKTATQTGGPVIEAPAQTQEPQYIRYDVPADGYPAVGPEDALITIVEFSDFECPFCRRWQQEVYEPLLAAYPGKVRMVYRNLPLSSIHPDAFPAAEAAMCADEQKSFWPYHDKLFSSEILGSEVYKQYAQEIGLDMTAFEACVTDHKYKTAIQKDSDFAVNLGVRSTPTFFINGLAIVGAQPLDVFKQVIDKELAGDIPK